MTPPKSPRFHSLDHPGSVLLGRWLIALVGIIAITVIFVWRLPGGQQMGYVVPGVQWLFVGVLAVSAGLATTILYSQAISTHSVLLRRLGAGMLYLTLLTPWMLASPPSALLAHQVIVGDASTACYLLFASAGGLFLTIAVAVALDERQRRLPTRAVQSQTRPAARSMAIGAAASVAVGLLLVLFANSLPPLMDSAGQATNTHIAWLLDAAVWAVAIVALCFLWPGMWRRSRLHVWLAFVIVAITLALYLQAHSTQAYDLAWYSARILAVIGSIVVVSMLLGHLFGLQRFLQAEVLRADLERDRADAAQVEAQRMAATDQLTGLPNRVGFFADLPKLFEVGHSDTLVPRQAGYSARRSALLVADIDGFKDVNYRHGHDAGNVVLRRVVDRLACVLADGDVLYRIGGDQFAIYLADLMEGGGATPAGNARLEAIRQCFTEPIDTGGSLVRVRTSMGMAVWYLQSQDPGELFAQADLAMHAAKLDPLVSLKLFDPSMEADAHERFAARTSLEGDIRQSAFSYHYQPIQDLRTGQLWGAEALIRCHRGGKLLAAGQFLPAAEQTGLLPDITQAALENFENDLPYLLNRLGPKSTVTFNISPVELTDSRLLDRLLGAGFAPWVRSIMLELTENAALENPDARAALAQLRRAGYRLAIDDLGTGYSNFTTVQELQPALIKLDRSLVAADSSAGVAASTPTFVTAAQVIGAALGAETLAEGIETPEQLAMVRERKIDLVQGYGIARPMPLRDLLQWRLGDPSPQPDSDSTKQGGRTYP